MKTLTTLPVFLLLLSITFPNSHFGQASNFQFSIIEKSANSILIKCSFSDDLPKTVKPSFLVALPGETVESIDVKTIGVRGSYISSSLFTDQFISDTTIIQIRGYHVLNIEFDPFINLKKKFPVSIIEVEIKFGEELLSTNSQYLRNRHWDKLIMDMVINPDDIGFSEFRLPERDEDGAEYLILTPDFFLESCRELIDFRVQQGISTMAVPLSITGSSVNEIELYINNAYNTWTIPPTAILLIGDMELLPGPIWQGYSVSDNIYADVNEDELPDLFISRIPVQSIYELEVIIEKIISHETNPPLDPDYYQHPLSCADHSSSGYGWMVSEIFNGWYEKEFNKEPNRQYSGQTPGPEAWPHPELYQTFGPDGLDYIPESPEYLGNYIDGNAQSINDGLNNGAMSLFSYTHGSSIGWQPPSYTIPDLSGIIDAQPTYLFAINSMNGLYHSYGDCIAEAFLKHPHGGLGVIAPAEVIYTNSTEWYAIGVIDGLWDDFYPANNPTQYYDFIYPCMANTSAKYFLEFLPYPINPQMKSVLFNLFHYFGEPFSVLFDGVPQTLNVTHQEYISPGQSEFSILANDGATIALILNDEICSVETSSGNQVAMPIIEPQEGDTLHVTVTKHNHIRYHSMVACQTGTGIDEAIFGQRIDVFPNPANSQLQVHFNKDINGLAKFTLIDLFGREIKTTSFIVSNDTKTDFLIALDDIVDGVYLLMVSNDDFSFSEKIIIQR